MNKQVILAVDQGSSSSRVLAIDKQGNVVASASRPVLVTRPSAALAEMNAQALLTGQIELLEEVLQQVGPESAVSVAISGQRSSIVLWDKMTGKPLAPVFSWQDGRAQQESAQAPISQEDVHQKTGLYKTPFYSAAKIAWALAHIPAVTQAADAGNLCVGPIASYLIWHLTKGEIFACDASLAQRTLLFNIRTHQWDPQLMQAFGIQADWLPTVFPAVADYGTWQYQGVSIPIHVCAGDQQAALTALQVAEGQACINYGTGAFFMRHTGKNCILLPGLLTSVGLSVNTLDKNYLLEGPVHVCATLFEWLKAQGIDFEMKELDRLVSSAPSPVWLLPALGGLGSPYWDFSASAVVAGLSAHTRKEDWLAGAVQAISFLLADIVQYVEKQDIDCPNLKVSGGMSHLNCLLQKQADSLQRPLQPCVEQEGSALGVALLAAQANGVDTATWKTLHYLPAISPRQSCEQAKQQYQKWQQFVSWARSYRS